MPMIQPTKGSAYLWAQGAASALSDGWMQLLRLPRLNLEDKVYEPHNFQGEQAGPELSGGLNPWRWFLAEAARSAP